MQMVSPTFEPSPALSSARKHQDAPAPTDVTAEEVRTMVLYLRKARDRAIDIRDRAPGGSYLEGVLTRTIDGITLELSQLDYLLARKPVDTAAEVSARRRMRPAI
ncbi:hypothetical protein [Roseibium sp.]|uniref:hypothetical protein n=2 Tax=Roseibium sp. TaxID=1936156 RepID=UPI003D151C6F